MSGSQMQGIAILYVYRTQRLAFRTHRNDIGAQHPVHIKGEGFYLIQIVIDCTHPYSFQEVNYLADVCFR